MTLARDGHMNRSGRLIAEPQELRRGLVTEDCSRTSCEHRGPQLSGVARASRKGRVDAGMERPPPIASDPEFDHVLAEAGPKSLGSRDDPALITGKVAERGWELTLHADQCEGRHRHWLPHAKDCG